MVALDTICRCYDAVRPPGLPAFKGQLIVFWMLGRKSFSQASKMKSCCPASFNIAKDGARKHGHHEAVLLVGFVGVCMGKQEFL